MSTITVFMKHDDRAVITFQNIDKEGYLPNIGPFSSDQTELIIDNETGKILNWKPLDVKDEQIVERE